MKCHILWNFIEVFTVCQNTRLVVSSIHRVNPFHFGYQQTGTLANNEDPDEMPHNAAFYQGLHIFAKIKTNLHDRNAS